MRNKSLLHVKLFHQDILFTWENGRIEVTGHLCLRAAQDWGHKAGLFYSVTKLTQDMHHMTPNKYQSTECLKLLFGRSPSQNLT